MHSNRFDFRRTVPLAALALVTALLVPAAAWAGAGQLDRSFGGDGKVITDFGQPLDRIEDAAIDSGGRIVAAGRTDTGQFALARYLPNGRLDRSFGGAGKVTTACGHTAYASSVAIDSQGRIVAAGACFPEAGSHQREAFAVMRYTPSGALDRSFGNSGIVRTSGGHEAIGVAIDSQGRIVVVANRGRYGHNGFLTVRYRPNGGLDPTFGDGGKVFTDADRAAPSSVAVDPQDRIVLGGFGTRRTADFELLRYRVDGSLDPAFGGDGEVFTNFGDRWDDIRSIAVYGRGRIVAAGITTADPTGLGGSAFAVARCLPDGTLDDAFSRNGKSRVRFNAVSVADDVAVDSHRRIVAAGWRGPFKHRSPEHPAFALARWRRSGKLDRSFSGNGKVTTTFKHWSEAHAVSIDSRDRIIAGGQLADFNFALARYIG